MSSITGSSPEVRAKAFTRWDTNKDGFLTLDEYKVGQKGGENLEARFNKFDKNSDGKLTREEFAGPSAKYLPTKFHQHESAPHQWWGGLYRGRNHLRSLGNSLRPLGNPNYPTEEALIPLE